MMMMQEIDPDTGPLWPVPLVHASATTFTGVLVARGGKPAVVARSAAGAPAPRRRSTGRKELS